MMQDRPAVLLLEDNHGDVGLISAALEDCSIDIDLQAVTEVDDAIAFLERRSPYQAAPEPALVITDFYRTPQPLAQRFLGYVEQHRDPPIPIVVLTAAADPRHRRECAKPWVAEYCVKPSAWEDYQTLVARLVRQWVKRRIRPA